MDTRSRGEHTAPHLATEILSEVLVRVVSEMALEDLRMSWADVAACLISFAVGAILGTVTGGKGDQ